MKKLAHCFLLFVISFGQSLANQPDLSNKIPASKEEKKETQIEKTFVIYMVTWSEFSDEEKGFIESLKEQHVSLNMIQYDCQQDDNKAASVVEEIKAMKQKPDIIYARGAAVVQAMLGAHDEKNNNYITDIPVVAIVSSDPVQLKISKTLENTGRNLALVFDHVPVEPQLSVWRKYFCKTKVRLAYIYNPKEMASLSIEAKLKELISKKDAVVDFYPLTNISEIEQIFESINHNNPDFLYCPNSNLLGINTHTITQNAKNCGVPVFSISESMIKSQEAMLSLACRSYYLGKLAAGYAKNILVNQAKPGVLPVLLPHRFSLILSKSVLNSVGQNGKKTNIYPPLSYVEDIEVKE